MTMGCKNTKKLPEDDEKKSKFHKVPSREFGPPQTVNNEMGKSTEKKPKKGRVLEGRFSFDPIVTENYEIKALIGRGSFSRVVRVEHKKTKQPYAIKMIKIREGKEVFESEVAVLRKVKHEFIVQLHEVYECAERVYLVMELATGGELFDRIVCRGSFTERDATQVMYMVLEGVRYLHSLGITHRDLKPENLLYYHPGADSKIMITDFGLSNTRQNAADKTMDTTCGTPEYIAPEILLRQSYTNAVDMWAIGVITHILLSGQMPFADENRTRLYKAILEAKYSYIGKAWKDVSDSAKDFIDHLLVLDPDKRMTAEEGLRHPWITSCASSSSLKNLHGSISQNWRKSSSRLNSARSNRSQKSNRSGKSGRSALSLKYTNNITVPQDVSLISALANAQAQEDKQSKPSALKESNVKLTKQLVEKLHSVINEDDREFLQSTSTVTESGATESRHTECECDGKQVRPSKSQTVVSYRENQNPDRRKINSLVLDYTSNGVEDWIARGVPVTSGQERSHLVMRDNFLEEQHQTQEIQEDNLNLGTSPRRLQQLSPSPRKNKVYCIYDTA